MNDRRQTAHTCIFSNLSGPRFAEFAIYPTPESYKDLQKHTHKRWTYASSTHLSLCHIHPSLCTSPPPPPPHLPTLSPSRMISASRFDVCTSIWPWECVCQTSRFCLQDWSTRCHPLQWRCLWFHGVVLSGMNIKSFLEHFTCTETHD